MAINQINLVDTETTCNSITQGESFSKTYLYPGDVTAATPTGQIRDNYAQDGGLLLGEFTFDTLTYFSTEDKTKIVANLDPATTSAIPYTDFLGEGTPTKKNCHLYDIELTFPTTEVKKVVRTSLVQVNPEITVI